VTSLSAQWGRGHGRVSLPEGAARAPRVQIQDPTSRVVNQTMLHGT